MVVEVKDGDFCRFRPDDRKKGEGGTEQNQLGHRILFSILLGSNRGKKA